MFVVVVVAVLGLGAFGYGGWYLVGSGALDSGPVYDGQGVDLDIERAFRTKGLMDLLERKVAQNERTLAMAKKSKDSVIADTMRLALAKNLEDLSKHQDAYIETLMSLQQAYKVDADRLKGALKQTLSAADEEYKMGRVDTVTGIVSLLNDAPVETPFKTYLTKILKPQKGSGAPETEG